MFFLKNQYPEKQGLRRLKLILKVFLFYPQKPISRKTRIKTKGLIFLLFDCKDLKNQYPEKQGLRQ